MDLKQYKTFRSNKFPVPIPTRTHKNINSICTLGILPSHQPQNYAIRRDSNRVIMWDSIEYVERQFDQLVDRGTEKQEQAITEIIDLVQSQLTHNRKNLFILPVLETKFIDELLIAKSTRRFSRPNNNCVDNNCIEQNQPPVQNREIELKFPSNCMLKSIVTQFIGNKRQSSIVCLAVLGVRPNMTLTEELDFQWFEGQDSVDSSMFSRRPSLKISKYKNEIRTFDLYRQEIHSWEQAEQILLCYTEIVDSVDEGALDDNTIGIMYEITQVELNGDSAIQEVLRKSIVFKIKQYMTGSSLMMMRLGQLINSTCSSPQKSRPIIRDSPALLFLSECFTSPYHVSLFTQLGSNQTIKDEYRCLSLNLEVPKQHLHLKNYQDNKKILNRITKLKEQSVFIRHYPQHDHQTDRFIQQKKNPNKVSRKLFYQQTYSSSGKRKPSIITRHDDHLHQQQYTVEPVQKEHSCNLSRQISGDIFGEKFDLKSPNQA